jgi:tetratricopeptide (TPR) repeat protein
MLRMKFIFLIGLLCLATFAQDPTRIAPTAYQTTFENEYVKVQKVYYAPRVTIPEHDHTAFAAAYVYLNDAGPVIFKHIGLDYGAVTRPAVKAGSFRLYKGVRETHEVESLSDTPSDFLRIELKTEPDSNPRTLRGKFFRLESPAGENFQQVQFENQQIRITRLICASGKKCEFTASTNEPVLFVALTNVRLKSARGKLSAMTTGQTQWLAAGRQWLWTNSGKESAEWLRFDFKTVPMKDADVEKPHVHSTQASGHSVGNPSERSAASANAEKKAEASALLQRGAALERTGQIAESIEMHEQALLLNPELVQAHVNLISLYGRNQQLAKAEQHYRAALTINPDVPDVHYNFGVLCAGQERFSEAAAAFRQCLQLNPYYAEAHFHYAAMIERDGKLNEAAAHYRKAIENKPGYVAAHFALGRILVNQNQMAEAIEQFQQTLTPESEETPRYLYALGATYLRAGEKEKGIQYLREALKRAKVLRQSQLVSSLERDLTALGQQ